MGSNNKTGIEKLEEYAYGMKPRRCDDVLELSAQIEREHVAELQTLEKRYKVDLRYAREARDIAIKEASKLRNDVNLAKDLVHDFRSDIAIMLGISCDGMDDDVQEAIEAELHKRLMPPDMEWPRFEDGEKVAFGVRVDGLDDVCEKYIFTRSQGGVCQLQDANGGMVNVLSRERAKRHEPEVIGADGVPIKVGDTVYLTTCKILFEVQAVRYGAAQDEFGEWYDAGLLTHTPPDTQERINDDVCKVADACTYFSSDGSCVKCKFVSKYGDADSAYEECPKSVELEQLAILDLLRRQRELDARTMGGGDTFKRNRKCVWSVDDDGSWDTGCGNKAIWEDDGNHPAFCPACGAKVVEP